MKSFSTYSLSLGILFVAMTTASTTFAATSSGKLTDQLNEKSFDPAKESSRDRAETEINNANPPVDVSAGKNKKPKAIESLATFSNTSGSATEGSVNSVSAKPIELKDTFAKSEDKSSWVTSVYIEKYAPEGTGEVQGVSRYNLNQSSETQLPTLSVGYQWPETYWHAWGLQNTFAGRLSYASQDLSINTPTGNQVDGRLNTARVALRETLGLITPYTNHIIPQLGFEFGQLTSAVSSNNSLARWSDSVNYTAWVAGLEAKVTTNWLLSANYRENQRLETYSGHATQVPARSFELGTGIQW